MRISARRGDKPDAGTLLLEGLVALLFLALALVLAASVLGPAVRGLHRAGDALTGELDERREATR